MRLENDFNTFVARRCEEALVEDVTYMSKEREPESDPCELQTLAEELCYKKGFADAMAIIKGI